MPRKPRELIDEGIYHVFNRGNDRRRLFGCNSDYQYFLDLLGKLRDELEFDLYHYCLMPNHFHLLLKIRYKKDLSGLMHRLQLAYARYFKKTYQFVGHVFQERFRSPRVSEESYYIQCGRYIERNPVKADMVHNAWEYLYSSAKLYALGEPDTLVTQNIYYRDLGVSDWERMEKYRQFLKVDEPYAKLLDEALSRA